MEHVRLRRIALLTAGISFGILTVLVLFCNSKGILRLSVKGYEYDVPAMQQNIVLNLPETEISFPCKIEGTDLVAESLFTYDGPFHEDGSGREVLNVAALKVYNADTEMTLYALIEVRVGGTVYTFEATRIPPNTSVLIPEKKGQRYISADITGCSGWSIEKAYTMDPDVLITEAGEGTLAVTNNSGEDLKALNVYHKTYLKDEDLYVGGMAFRTLVLDLKAGQTVFITPEYYASGSSRILYYE